MNKEQTEKKEKIYSIRFDSEELKALKDWVKEYCSGKPLSKFIREAIEEKKQRIINPPQVNGNGLPLSFKAFIENQEKKTEKLTQMIKNLQNDLARRNDLLDVIKHRSNEIANGQDYSEETEELVKIYEERIETVNRAYLTVQELIETSKLPRVVVMHVLQQSGRFLPKQRGWTLR